MSVPMKRHTSGKVRRRRSHHALAKKSLRKCSQCGQPVKPHAACSYCGYYKGREAVKIKAKKEKKK